MPVTNGAGAGLEVFALCHLRQDQTVALFLIAVQADECFTFIAFDGDAVRAGQAVSSPRIR
ncbi:hypothetical protein [Roseobacter cerasinus]|uniref:hypothetical protein n=1 Tax=Roseobacter cerasinus TaxID=2602289 RepID=UPI00135878D4|nr:hypothetical protein [Roseobacter cerasinus]